MELQKSKETAVSRVVDSDMEMSLNQEHTVELTVTRDYLPVL